MATFEFKSEGIQAGYGENGFFAFGETTDFQFDEREWPGHDLPNIRSMKLVWAINTRGDDQWKEYNDIIDAYAFDHANWPRTERASEIERAYADRQRLGLFTRWHPGKMSLTYSLNPDPTLAVVIMGAIGAGREIDFFAQGFLFADEGKVAAAPTVSGWSERKEPLILADHPTIRVA